MLAKRIIPCLDMMNGRVVKGIGFKKLKDAGDPVDLASYYYKEGADELIFLDITASYENREILIDVVKRTSKVLFIPFTVGGGIHSLDDIRKILCAGADRVTINTAAVRKPKTIVKASKIFGSQCIVASIDIRREYLTKESDAQGKNIVDTDKGRCWWSIYIYGGKKRVNLDALKWAEKTVELGAGEIAVSSLDFDGRKQGYDIDFLRELSSRVSVPIIASSGAGSPEHVLLALTKGNADAALAASIFHYGIYSIRELKDYLANHGVKVRE